MRVRILCSFILILVVFPGRALAQTEFVIAQGKDVAHIVYDIDAAPLTAIAAELLAQDIFNIFGTKPEIHHDLNSFSGRAIIIGTTSSTLIKNFISTQSAPKDEWESYRYAFLDKPTANIDQAMFITGSDLRGMAYGVFALSEEMGVSPWYWWADVPIEHKDQIAIKKVNKKVASPSVKYRGIFLNDEDWGLRPWAAKTFEPEVGNIGPRTYAKIFELMLRLKANLLWPAMHPGTDAFFSNKANIETAKSWQIVIGSSHAEPMLRNNVGEWNESKDGHFNYLTNSKTIQNYWSTRVTESQNLEAIYTLGMRGIHDSGMEGVNSVAQARELTEKIIAHQRSMLAAQLAKDVKTIPQALVPYKEVLEIYDSGLSLSDDITLVWPDDNYGYIRRLNNSRERTRSGGAGVYYHASYWGRPHDYQWLSTTHPALIREEMVKAYNTGARDIWVLNVGDLKPLEYATSLFLEMAYDISKFKQAGSEKKHLEEWLDGLFPNNSQLADMLWQYYNLAFERRPEFMGWSQTEPTTATTRTAYNHFNFGDEAQKRLTQYDTLQVQTENYAKRIPEKYADAYFQLIQYPLVSAALINKKFLYLDKANYYQDQNRASAKRYEQLSQQAYQDILKSTAYYNNTVSSGKWAHMMPMAPRNLPVFLAPEKISSLNSKPKSKQTETVGLTLEGSAKNQIAESSENLNLPAFTPWGQAEYFVDIYLSENTEAPWSAKSSDGWLNLSSNKLKTAKTLSGKLNKEKDEQRIWVSVNWAELGKQINAEGSVELTVGPVTKKINIHAHNPQIDGIDEKADAFIENDFIESNGYLSIHAENYHEKENSPSLAWEKLTGLGRTGSVMQAEQKAPAKNESPTLTYDFYNFTHTAPTIYIFCLPVHPINNQHSLRLAVSIDKGPSTVLDFKEEGRSETWKQNVLANSAVKSFTNDMLKPGKHTLKITALDPGVSLDRIEIDFGGLPAHYSVLAETKKLDLNRKPHDAPK